jgi:DNA-binding response OmpR family regulator
MKRVLLIEDEQILLELLDRKLRSQGYETFLANDGEKGLQLARQIVPDIIILDIVMPKMDGFTVMAEIQKDKNLKEIPIIIVSNSGQSVELSKARQLGARDWLIKTEFDPQEVIEKIKKQIGE